MHRGGPPGFRNNRASLAYQQSNLKNCATLLRRPGVMWSRIWATGRSGMSEYSTLSAPHDELGMIWYHQSTNRGPATFRSGQSPALRFLACASQAEIVRTALETSDYSTTSPSTTSSPPAWRCACSG